MNDDKSPNEPRRAKVVFYSFLVVLCFILFLAFLVFRHFLVTVAVSASVAVLLGPIYDRLTKALRGRRSASAALPVAWGAGLRGIAPVSTAQAEEIYDRLTRTVKAVLYSMVVVPVAQGLLAMIGFKIFGLPSPLFWGTMLCFAAVIPGIGSPLVWLPAAAFLLLA